MKRVMASLTTQTPRTPEDEGKHFTAYIFVNMPDVYTRDDVLMAVMARVVNMRFSDRELSVNKMFTYEEVPNGNPAPY